MIQLTNLQRLQRRKDAGLQSGFDQDIYRVLAISQTVVNRLYTAAMVIKLGWNPERRKEEYQDEYSVLYSWANKKRITETTHHRDESGKPLKPAMWTGEGWQSEVADKLWNLAVDIHIQGCDLKEAKEAEGQMDNTYWYDADFGVFAIPPEQLEMINAIANKKHSNVKAEKQNKPFDRSWHDELKSLLHPDVIEQEPEPEKQEEDQAAIVARMVTEQLVGMETQKAAAVAELVTAQMESLLANTQPRPEQLADLVTERVMALVAQEPPPINEGEKRRPGWPHLFSSVAAILLAFIWITQTNSNEPPPQPRETITEENLNPLSQDLSISDAAALTTTIEKKATSQLPLNKWESYVANWSDDRLIITAENSEHQNPKLFFNSPMVLASLP